MAVDVGPQLFLMEMSLAFSFVSQCLVNVFWSFSPHLDAVCTNEGSFFGESRLRMLLSGLLHVIGRFLFLNTDRHKLGPFCLRATHVEMAWKESHWKGA